MLCLFFPAVLAEQSEALRSVAILTLAPDTAVESRDDRMSSSQASVEVSGQHDSCAMMSYLCFVATHQVAGTQHVIAQRTDSGTRKLNASMQL
ncbi:hypothetical protein CONLIGDRAFT_450 [Coniochaeta ligniaria NRRL 30616]|uniref:Uncharacterized protein n=1 Tax=Coniochaeta ligniaria NRRL 30616 TaxID=1408157 RepID=A0A1J7J2E8_9PEZI|nr:hypothetical protein CONLIGDRAFT_450 [Coniochaeta ligniaria NRRL 30616]